MQNKGNFQINKKMKDMSLMTVWNRDPLMDQKQLVVMTFKEDAFTGRPFFNLRENLQISATSVEVKKHSKASVAKLQNKETHSTCVCKSSKAVQQDIRLHPLKGNVEQVSQISPLNTSITNSASEAAVLFADFCSGENDVKKPEIRKAFQNGPDATQLSSVLLELREEVRFNFVFCHGARGAIIFM